MVCCLGHNSAVINRRNIPPSSPARCIPQAIEKDAQNTVLTMKQYATSALAPMMLMMVFSALLTHILVTTVMNLTDCDFDIKLEECCMPGHMLKHQEEYCT